MPDEVTARSGTGVKPTPDGRVDTLLTSLAMLSANWEAGRSHVDWFVPFVAEALRDTKPGQGVTPTEVRAYVAAEFGFDMPAAAVQTVLGRAKRLGYCKKSRHIFKAVHHALPQESLAKERQKHRREIDALVDRFKRYAYDHHDIDLDDTAAEVELLNLVQEWSLPILSSAMRGKELTPTEVQADGTLRYVVADFVVATWRRDPEGAGYLEALVKGNMIRSAMYVDLGRIEQRFTGMYAYLDTPFLLEVLGLLGKEREDAALELIHLARDLGVNLACFGETLSELRGVIHRQADSARPRRGSRRSASVLPFQASSAQLDRLATRLDRSLRDLGVQVVDRPDWERQDNEIEHALREELAWYSKEASIDHDVVCLVSVYRLRSRRKHPRIEDCQAIFITTNEPLVAASRRVVDGGDCSNAPVAMLGHEFATLLWLKKPTNAPSLPMKQVIADCYAALDPSDALWTRYLEEIEELSKAGEVTVDDYLIARNEFEMRGELMAVTKGSPDHLSPRAIVDALERVKQRIADEAKATADEEAQKARAEASAVGKELQAASTAAAAQVDEARLVGRIEARDALAAGAADLTVKVLLAIAFGVVVLGTVAGVSQIVGWKMPSWIWQAAIVLAALAVAAQVVFGWTVRSLLIGRVRTLIQKGVAKLIDWQLQLRT